MKAYKGFNKGMTCRGFQFEEGKTYEEPEAKLCESGFHACENPLDCLYYYDIIDGEFHKVELEDVSDERQKDTKICGKKITIGAKLDIKGMVAASIEFVMQSVKNGKSQKKHNDNGKDSDKLASSGDYAKLASSGYSAQLASSGYYAKLASSGDYAKLASSGYSAKLASSGDYAKLDLRGKYSVGAAIGFCSKIRGKIGDWIVLAEWKHDEELQRYVPVCVKSAQVDGEKLKEDTWYTLEDGEFKEDK